MEAETCQKEVPTKIRILFLKGISSTEEKMQKKIEKGPMGFIDFVKLKADILIIIKV